MTNKIEQTYIDKSSWADGPWKNEPDRLFWIDSETNLPCIVWRNPKCGILCGYVGIMKDHPFYEKECTYDENGIDSKLQCHGGVTYTSEGEHLLECFDDHTKFSNKYNKAWWIGFDCGHFMDKEPKEFSPILTIDQEYHDIAYVTKEVESLARQLKNMEKANANK